MRSNVTEYELRTPTGLSEVLALLEREPGVWKPFAGGTDLMVLLEAGKLPHRKFLNLLTLPELKGIENTMSHVLLGALITFSEILQSETLAAEFPLLGRAASVTGGVATQNRGTLGGNIANASPAADTPPALLVYDAEVEVVSASGAKWIPYDDFHTGYKQMKLQPEELIRGIRLPRVSKPRQHYYRKVGTRKAQAISKVCFAGLAEVESGTIQEVRIALGSVAPTVLRCVKTEAVVKGRKVDAGIIQKARAVLAEEISPIDDIRSTKQYRSQVAQNLLGDFLESLLSGADHPHLIVT